MGVLLSFKCIFAIMFTIAIAGCLFLSVRWLVAILGTVWLVLFGWSSGVWHGCTIDEWDYFLVVLSVILMSALQILGFLSYRLLRC